MTGWLLMALVCVAGGIGAALRLIMDGLINATTRRSYPLATTVINLSGSLLLGLLTGWAARAVVPEAGLLIVGTGLLGGYTTFSTASFDTVRLIEQRRWPAALVNGLGQLVLATGLAALGFAVGAAGTV